MLTRRQTLPRRDDTSEAWQNPSGFIRDVFEAHSYRAALDDLLHNGWIDDKTAIVAARLNLANAQTGCLAHADVMFEQSDAGVWYPSLDQHIACVPGLPLCSNALIDFKRSLPSISNRRVSLPACRMQVPMVQVTMCGLESDLMTCFRGSSCHSRC